jgi:hypothetical protein
MKVAIWPAMLLSLFATTASAQQLNMTVASTSHPVIAGTANEFFKAISSQEIRIAEGTKVTTVHGTDGQLLGIIIIGQKKGGGGPSLTCGCSLSACSASNCKTSLDTTKTVADLRGNVQLQRGDCDVRRLYVRAIDWYIAAAVDCPRLRHNGRTTTDAGAMKKQAGKADTGGREVRQLHANLPDLRNERRDSARGGTRKPLSDC